MDLKNRCLTPHPPVHHKLSCDDDCKPHKKPCLTVIKKTSKPVECPQHASPKQHHCDSPPHCHPKPPCHVVEHGHHSDSDSDSEHHSDHDSDTHCNTCVCGECTDN